MRMIMPNEKRLDRKTEKSEPKKNVIDKNRSISQLTLLREKSVLGRVDSVQISRIFMRVLHL